MLHGYKNLEELINYQRAIVKLNSTVNGALNCSGLGDFSHKHIKIKVTLEGISIAIWILGVIGNILGVYVMAHQDPKYIRVYLTRIFYSVNLLNMVFMAIYPVLDLVTETRLVPFRYRYPWKVYITYVHFPFAKAFVNFSFGIYVLFALIQMTAVLFPMFFRRFVSFKRLKIGLVLTFFFFAAWYMPSAWWFEIIRHANICGFPPDAVIYTRNFAQYKSKRAERSWIAYGFVREFVTTFLPVGIIMYLQRLTLQKKRKIIEWRQNLVRRDVTATTPSSMLRVAGGQLSSLPLTPKTKKSIEDEVFLPSPVVIPDSARDSPSSIEQGAIDSMNAEPLPSVRGNTAYGSPTNAVSSILVHYAAENESSISGSRQRRLAQKRAEYKNSRRMLRILMAQFIVFLFPVSIYIITVDFYDEFLTSGWSSFAFAVCVLMEYCYISLTFYLNMMFNPDYRKEVIDTLTSICSVNKVKPRRIT